MTDSSDDIGICPQFNKFVEHLPKVELHAHLNGCIREKTLAELAAERNVSLSTHHFDGSSGSSSTCILRNTKPRSLRDCFDMFAEIPRCVSDLEALRRITLEALQDFSNHHVVYLELRSTPKRLLWRHNDSGNSRATKRDYVETILDAMESYEKSQIKATQTSRLSLVPRFIVSIDRSGTAEEAMENAKLAIEFFQSGQPYVVGVDLGGNPTKNDFSYFQPAFQMARDAGLRVTIHCGELQCEELCETEPSSTLQRNTYRELEAILAFQPDRIGHALLLPPSLNSALEKSRIPVECCPTSNVMTLELATHYDGDLVHGLKRHPQLEHWLKTGHPISISTDDSGVFNTDPTQELLLLTLAWNLDKTDLRRIVQQSIEHAFCDKETKARLQKEFLGHIRESVSGSG